VKLTAALAKLSEEDPSLSFAHNPDTHELLLHGQGDIHLQIALERLKLRYNLPGQGAPSAGQLQGDDPGAGEAARPLQATVRRPRPVRRRACRSLATDSRPGL
jgi:elongation factor G